MIRCYVFDQDGTLYSKENELTRVITRKTKRCLIDRLGINENDVENLYTFLQKLYPNIFDGFGSLGISIEDYYSDVFEQIDPSEYLERDVRLISLLGQKLTVPKYVVTLSSKRFSSKVLQALGIAELIDGTYFMEDFLPNHSKLCAYNEIKRSLDLNPSDVCIVGDNFEVDIEPALRAGFQTVLIGDASNSSTVRKVDSIYRI